MQQKAFNTEGNFGVDRERACSMTMVSRLWAING